MYSWFYISKIIFPQHIYKLQKMRFLVFQILVTMATKVFLYILPYEMHRVTALLVYPLLFILISFVLFFIKLQKMRFRDIFIFRYHGNQAYRYTHFNLSIIVLMGNHFLSFSKSLFVQNCKKWDFWIFQIRLPWQPNIKMHIFS